MVLVFKKITKEDYSLWENLNRETDSCFNNCINWIDFQKSLGKELDCFLLYTNVDGVLTHIGNLQIELSKRKIAKYAYAPYSPVVNWNVLGEKLLREDIYYSFYEELKKFAKKYIEENQLNLFRFDPVLPKKHKKTFESLGFKKSLSVGYPEYYSEIDLNKSEDEILNIMNKTKRYSIKKGIKDGVIVERITTPGDLEKFFHLLALTSRRKGFELTGEDYYKKQFEALNNKGVTEVFLAKYKNKILAGALINIYNKKGYYSYAGSIDDKETNKFNAPYVLIWEIIKYLKSANCEKFNLWGVLPDEITNHSLKGVSDFKKSFGGETKETLGLWEIYNNRLKYGVNRMYDWWVYRKDRIKIPISLAKDSGSD